MIVLIGKPSVIVRGGYWDGCLIASSLESHGANIRIEAHSSTVSCLAVDDSERMAVTGSKKGDIAMWNVSADKMSWEPSHRFYHHTDLVSCVKIYN